MKRTGWFIAVFVFAFSFSAPYAAPPAHAETCDARDNGDGTAALPADCPYVNEEGTMDIVDGLAPGDRLQSSVRISSFFDIFTELG
ncbi:MAG TPA: hypothetical protein PLI07_09935, partial [Candidatus Hydrogenedentes bacterium]|nr:hypothetical protein [Candidatus Hydrogenedentota bacterium]